MPDAIDGTGRIRSSAGAVVLDLNTAPYALATWSDDEEVSDRITAESPWVDGDAEVNYRLIASVVEITVRVEGDTWAAVETAFRNLRDAVKAESQWVLERFIEGVSTQWLASRPLSIASPITSADITNRRRLVTLRIPVQPSPTVSGLEL